MKNARISHALLQKGALCLLGIFFALSMLAVGARAEDNVPSSAAPDRRFSLGESLEEPAKPDMENPSLFHFNQQRWNQMRRSLEGGPETTESFKKIETSTKTVQPPKPPPGLIQVDLPYESSLSITGRKVIK